MNSVLVWQIIATVIGALALIVAIVSFRLNWKRKRFSYQIIENIELVEVANSYKERIDILIDGKKISNCSSIIIRIFNNGNVPIKKEDFDDTLIINLGKESEVHEVNVVNVFPNGLKLKTTTNIDSIIIDPLLLNPKDYFDLSILVSNPKQISISGRIIGVKEIGDLTTRIEDYTEILDMVISSTPILGINLDVIKKLIEIMTKRNRLRKLP